MVFCKGLMCFRSHFTAKVLFRLLVFMEISCCKWRRVYGPLTSWKLRDNPCLLLLAVNPKQKIESSYLSWASTTVSKCSCCINSSLCQQASPRHDYYHAQDIQGLLWDGYKNDGFKKSKYKKMLKSKALELENLQVFWSVSSILRVLHTIVIFMSK